MKTSRLGVALALIGAAAAATGTVPTTGSAQGEEWGETELARETFRDASSWRDRWVVEGSGEISAGDGRLTVNFAASDDLVAPAAACGCGDSADGRRGRVG